MKKVYEFTCKEITEICELLNKHYGVGIFYFIDKRLSDSYSESDLIYTPQYVKNADNELLLVFELDYEQDFLPHFPTHRKSINQKGNEVLKPFDLPNTPENEQIILALWLAVFVFMNERPKKTFTSWNDLLGALDLDDENIQDMLNLHADEWVDQIYTPIVRRDLLELYIFVNSLLQDRASANELTIKCGKHKLVLENKDNWFAKVALRNHLDRYLEDVKSVDDAKKELNKIKHPGRPLPHPYLYHFIYGTYSMLSEYLKTDKVSESICELILGLLNEMDYPTLYIDSRKNKYGEWISREMEMDKYYIRKTISNMKLEQRTYSMDLCRMHTLSDRSGKFFKATFGRYKNMQR